MHVSIAKLVVLIAASGAISIVSQATAEGQTISAEDAQTSSPQQVDAEKLLADFSQAWDDSKWEKEFRGSNHIRQTGDAGWNVRAETLRQLVAGGEASIPALEKALTSENTPTRILAAQAIGYLAPSASIQKLTKIVQT